MTVELRLPGDKSISHRVAMLAAVSDGRCEISNFNSGADCASTLRCLQQLGARVSGNVVIDAASKLRSASVPLDCGNSGSTIRMLTGLLCGWNVAAELTGDESLRRRPMSRVAAPLRQMGAVIEMRDGDFAPLVIREGVKRPIDYTMPMASAQVKSAVLLAGLKQPGTRVRESIPTRDHTERLLSWLKAGDHIPAFQYEVPADPSSAAFFIGAALMAGKDLMLRSVLVNPLRTAYIRVLQQAGARIEIRNQQDRRNEPVADVQVAGGGRLGPLKIESSLVPALIDEIPVLAVIGSQGGFEVSGARELRYKESDRISAMVAGLREAGLRVEEQEDGFRVFPGELRGSAPARTFGDHRIAMAFAAAGFPVDDPECVRISLPEFFDLLKQVVA